MTDFELVRRAAAGDAAAVAGLWREHRRWVAAVLLSSRRHPDELDDLLQEVAVILLQRIADLRDPTAFRPWLASVARNVALTSLRRETVRRRVLRPLGEGDAEPADARVERERRGRDAGAQLERVLRVVAGLPPEWREPLLLRAVDGLGQADVAAILGVPVTTVETRLARARRALRAALREQAALLAEEGPPGPAPRPSGAPQPATLSTGGPSTARGPTHAPITGRTRP